MKIILFITKTVHFSADEIPVIKFPDGHDLTYEYLMEHGFSNPILVYQKEGLNLRVPPSNFSIQDVENHVGGSYILLLLMNKL